MTPMSRQTEPMTDTPGTGAQNRDRVELRRQLRKESTDAERLLWRLLRDRQACGAKFRRQHPVGPYVLDFYCPKQRLAVEADGGQHLTVEGMARDNARTRYLEDKGIRVLRLTNLEILQNKDTVLEAISQALAERPSP